MLRNKFNPFKEVFLKPILFAGMFRFLKITTDLYILAHVQTVCPDKYPILRIYIPEPNLGNYEYIPVAYVTMQRIMWSWLKYLSLASWVQEVS